MPLSRALPWLAAAILLFALAWHQQRPSAPAEATGHDRTAVAGGAGDAQAVLPGFLPAEAAPVIAAIQRGDRFAHRQDGSVFGNRERRLPARDHGYYREYTVPTPGLSHRGARRIVTGGDPPAEWYYTADHYDSFRRFEPPAAEAAP
ncbi:guanyl-specific ribonuclease [Pseudoxanthomonas sp. 10H]|uniref:ribonuclease domain-containing protein n=1 Tax=Pseudoxanthomonas sp. 10H TaxID=3242729 RepID=UPI003558E1AB